MDYYSVAALYIRYMNTDEFKLSWRIMARSAASSRMSSF